MSVVLIIRSVISLVVSENSIHIYQVYCKHFTSLGVLLDFGQRGSVEQHMLGMQEHYKRWGAQLVMLLRKWCLHIPCVHVREGGIVVKRQGARIFTSVKSLMTQYLPLFSAVPCLPELTGHVYCCWHSGHLVVAGQWSALYGNSCTLQDVCKQVVADRWQHSHCPLLCNK